MYSSGSDLCRAGILLAHTVRSLLTFRDNNPKILLGLLTLEDGNESLSEKSAANYHHTLCNFPERRTSHLHWGGDLKSSILVDHSI